MEQIECEVLPSSKALRDAIICVGWLKLASLLWYILLFLLTTAKSRGDVTNALRFMLMAIVPLQIANALLLFYCALEGRLVAVEVCLWLCLTLAVYNLVLGLVGCVYFIRIGHEDLHFVLATLYLLVALSLFTVLCHDVLVLYAFKQVLLCASKFTPCPD